MLLYSCRYDTLAGTIQPNEWITGNLIKFNTTMHYEITLYTQYSTINHLYVTSEALIKRVTVAYKANIVLRT